MSSEQDRNNREMAAARSKIESTDLYAKSREYLQQPVRIETNDGQTFQGIIENVDNQYIYLAVAQDEGSAGFRGSENRQVFGYGYPPYYSPWYGGYYGGYPPYGYPYGYGYYGYPRRFSRLILPLAALTAISLLPYY